MQSHERIKVVEGGSWTFGGAKKRHGEPEQLLSTGGATWRLRVAVEWRGARGRRERGGAEAVAELPGDAWSGAEAGPSLQQRGNGGAAVAAEETEEEKRGGEILGSYLQLQEL
jgi:hypothetical protein